MTTMRKLAMLAVILFIPSLSLAAYQNPTVVTNERQINGSVVLTFAFSGNSGEPTVTRSYVVSQGTTAIAVRNWIDDTIKELELVHTAATLPALQKDQVVTRLAKVNPARAAKDVWNEKAARYRDFKDLGITAAAADLASLKADLEATYQAGFILP